MPGEESRQAARTRLDAAVPEPVAEFPQEGERVFLEDPKDEGSLRFQTLRATVAAHGLGRDLPVLTVPLALPDRAGCSDAEAFGRLTPRCACFDRGDHTLM